MLPSPPTGYTFDQFEVQLRKGVLLRNKSRVRIQRLPYQMLLTLLERPGETVSREDICSALWKGETSFELENRLYVAAAKLREALGDDPANPRYVKTVARHGYQFVAAVIVVESAANHNDAQLAATAGPLSLSSLIPEHELTLDTGTIPSPWRTSAIRFLMTGLAVAALCGGLLYKLLSRPLISSSDKVVLGEVRNASGDPSLDDVFSPALRFKLQESPFLSFVESQQFRRQSSMDNRGQISPASSLEDGLKACTQFGAQLFLAGTIVTRSPGYRVEVDAWRCQDRRLLATQSEKAASQAEIL